MSEALFISNFCPYQQKFKTGNIMAFLWWKNPKFREFNNFLRCGNEKWKIPILIPQYSKRKLVAQYWKFQL